MTRTALEVLNSFEITGPDGDNTMWLRISDQGDGKEAMFNLGGYKKGITHDPLLAFEEHRKAVTDMQLTTDQIVDMVDPFSRPIPESLTEPPETPDYRFGRLVKGEKYAYARGLVINPTHLPKALDAMEADGWSLVAIFGETDAENIGFIFRKRTARFGLDKGNDFEVLDFEHLERIIDNGRNES